ncbi:MAG: OmpA family protein [Rhodocyclaceae bacterium]
MKYRLMTLAVASAVAAGCASHSARDRLDIQNPAAREAGALTAQSIDSGALPRQSMRYRAGEAPQTAPTDSQDVWMAQYGRYMYDRSAGLDRLQQQLKAQGAAAEGYDGAKAQCWIDAGRSEQAQHNGWGFVEEAMGEADRLTTGIAQGKRWMGNNPLRTSVTVRPDLWAKIGAMHADKRMPHCPPAQKRVACQEVSLMWAGHDAWARDYDAAEEKVNAVAEAMQMAQGELAQCHEPVPPVAPPKAQPAPVIDISADALFRFDRGGREDMLPAGKAQLDELARTIAQVPSVKALSIVGHTDRLGDAAYNARLSRQRADTVKAYLQDQGVAVPMYTSGAGSAEPVVNCPGTKTAATISCLQPNRRVEIRIEHIPR